MYSQNGRSVQHYWIFIGVTSEQIIQRTLREGTGKVTLCLSTRSQAPRHEDVCGSEGIAPSFLTSALDGGEWSASRHFCFTLE
jgi:hypothetical protein